MTATTPPVRIWASGGPYERGEQIGRQTADQVRRSITIYDETFQHHTGRGWADIRGYAAAYVPAITGYDPDIVPEMQGLADGAGVTFEDVLALNTRTEVMFGLKQAGWSECTAFGVTGARAGGRVLVGQNWDWRPATAATSVLLECAPSADPAFVTYVEAGLLAKIGYNAAGVGVMANLLITDQDRGRPGVPFHVVLRRLFKARTLAEAVEAVRLANRSASANYLLADAGGEIVDLETGPGGVDTIQRIDPSDGIVCHANSFCTPLPGTVDLGLEALPDSPHRRGRLESLIADEPGEVTPERLCTFLRDHDGHPGSICRHPDPSQHPVERLATNASLVVDLAARRMWLAPGPPCTTVHEMITPDFASRMTSAGERR
ncbi:MAG: peptidase C45 [Streptosporangiales bacterium]|nr:peptidase C45 [Streptosporangiales bacterium]